MTKELEKTKLKSRQLTAKKSKEVLSPLKSIYDFWPTRWTSFFDFDYNPTGITVGGDDDTISVSFEVPGFTKEQIKVSVYKERELRVECKSDNKSAYFSSTIPSTAKQDSPIVGLEDGVLTVIFGRTEDSKPKVLPIL